MMRTILKNNRGCYIDDVADGIVANSWQWMWKWRSIWASKCGLIDRVPTMNSIRKNLETTLFQGFLCGRGRRTWPYAAASPCILMVRRPKFLRISVPVSPLFAKNSSTNCFLNAQTLTGSSPFYSISKQKRLPFGNRFRFGRGRRTWTLGTRFWSEKHAFS